MTMATTFHSFPRLPFEIRSQIWALAAHPRLVHIRTQPKPGRFEGHRWAGADRYFASMIPQAELMHVCRESRQLAPYQKAFFTTLPGESEARYIWFNFNEDMISLQHENLYGLDPHAADIQRLRFMVPTGREFEDWAEGFTRFTKDRFKQFTALREVHFAVSSGMTHWGTTSCSYRICSNVRFVDLHTGLMLTHPQIELAEQWNSEKGWLVQDMDNFDEELQWANDNMKTFIEDWSEVE
ncbi:uncharacterized protein TrAtP1_010220 [Trichoderma atroviride]|uniref:2EXR domain-containing protein n=1 Tax=Hypocrea atroviridis (strain ATCC 20476 / IMI 206040) TaxID=452589 RepID=G9NPX6_HYPAI|nr:uncharacterized protein TRIATDRAFT_298895 [Trichoderma atroviride IMI 206040]EHK47129.1 hypothetical protein TRIATDRAFT_298895 [Trichoderma atroviride IMI 206040]UKZ69210.1 hypothetical protein TrAtP1_010220 [Trichoderma atroviride]